MSTFFLKGFILGGAGVGPDCSSVVGFPQGKRKMC